MRFADLDIDELLELVNDPATPPDLRERAILFLKRNMDYER